MIKPLKFLSGMCLLMTALFLLAGCTSTTITINRVEPPKYNIPEGKKLAVLDFVGPKKAPSSGRAFASALVARLAPTEYYQLTERAQIQNVIRELKFGSTDYVDPNTVKRIGRVIGADYLLVGEVTAYSVEDSQSSKEVLNQVFAGYHYDHHGRQVADFQTQIARVPMTVRNGTVSATFRLVDIETGSIIASDQQTRTFRRSNEEFIGSKELPSKDQILSRLTDEVVDTFVRKIAPFRVRESRVLEYGKHPLVKRGVRLAENGLWREAVETWQEARQSAPQDPAIYNNLGVAAETKGDYGSAEKLYQEALQINSNSTLYMKSLNRVRHLKKLYEERTASSEDDDEKP